MTRLIAILTLLVSAIILSGCGIRGDLQTPPPVWGADKADTPEMAETAEDETEELDFPEEEDPGYGIDVTDQP